MNWEQIGHVLDRPEQLPRDGAGVSRGIFAPSIRFHNGRYYMITTNVSGVGNFYVTTENPAGPWSNPIARPEIQGIDPSFFFDDDEKAYIVHNGVPYWAKGGNCEVNGRAVPAFADPGSYFVLCGPWKNGDRIELSLPMHLHAAPMPYRESLQAVMFGPLVSAARFEEELREKWYRHFITEEKQEPAPTLQFGGKLDDPASWLEPSDGKLRFRTQGQKQTATFVPLSRTIHERYSVYYEINQGSASRKDDRANG